MNFSRWRLLAVVATLAVAGSAAAQPLAQDRKPGSVLIYLSHRSGPGMFTIISVTNTAQAPATPTAFGGSVSLHFEYVNVTPNPANPFRPLRCEIFDRIEFMTPADTLSVLTQCHNAYRPGGQEGYLVVSAQDPAQFDVDICHDFLIGSEIVINATGIMFTINAVPVQCAAGPPGTPTDINGNGALDFDGFEYLPLADVVYMDSYIAVSRSQLCLINLTGFHDDVNKLALSVWNDNEFALSATLDFNCWFDQPLHLVSPLFSAAFLASLPNDPGELDINCDGIGDLETGWAAIDSRGVCTVGGTIIAPDGVIIGCVTAGLGGDPILWHDDVPQPNGLFVGRPEQQGQPEGY